jgi:hypothetical protein
MNTQKYKNRTISQLKFPDIQELDKFWNKRYDSAFHTDTLGRLTSRSDSPIKNKVGKIYEVGDKILRELFSKHPANTPNTIEYVYFKVKLLNDFYSTGILDIYSVVEKIVEIENLDNLLKEGKDEAVEKIRHAVENRDFYSFATKYCHFSNPKEYSIYDQYVGKLLVDYTMEYLVSDKEKVSFDDFIQDCNKNGLCNIDIEKIRNKSKGRIDISNAIRENYTFFNKLIELFINNCELPKSYKDKRAKIDNYLWLAGMMKYRKDSKVKDMYTKPKKAKQSAA